MLRYNIKMPFKRIDLLWKDLSVSKKLYTVVGLMTFLIALELVTLKYTVNILSAVRGFVAGEGLWSKAQKNALLDIQNYIIFRDEKHYQSFLNHLAVPLGDREARLELMTPNPDYNKIYNGFVKGRNHHSDIPGMINLIMRYHWVSYLSRSIEAWVQGDQLIDDVISLGSAVHEEVLKTPRGKPLPSQVLFLQQISDVNTKVTFYADKFSYSLGEASRWVESSLFLLLLFVILAVESTGLFFTFKFSNTLVRSLNELNETAKKIGTGDFSQRAPVHSQDELGQLAMALNKMSKNLQEVSGEKNQAEEASQIKSLFLANMSHEIRTPLGAILGFVELLKESNLSERNRKQYLNIISRTGDALVTIINDILDLSKVEAGKIEVVKEVFSLDQLIRDLHLLLKLRSDDKGIELTFEAAPGTPEYIYSDPMRLRQILMNVVGNAIKFTQKGSVHVKYEVKPGDNMIFYIKDTGPGIAAHEVAKLFKPFSQGDLSIRKIHGGTGLGLVLSRKLADLLGGTVALEHSMPGDGSIFVVKIAYEVPDRLQNNLTAFAGVERRKQHVDIASVAGKNILLVEDTTENQILISHILSKNGATVKIAHNGKEALEMVQAGSFDVILMDMQMPVLDGYSATAILRQRGYKKPIISLTAHAMREDLRKCIDVGCDEVLTKPVNKLQLLETISRYCA